MRTNTCVSHQPFIYLHITRALNLLSSFSGSPNFILAAVYNSMSKIRRTRGGNCLTSSENCARKFTSTCSGQLSSWHHKWKAIISVTPLNHSKCHSVSSIVRCNKTTCRYFKSTPPPKCGWLAIIFLPAAARPLTRTTFPAHLIRTSFPSAVQRARGEIQSDTPTRMIRAL